MSSATHRIVEERHVSGRICLIAFEPDGDPSTHDEVWVDETGRRWGSVMSRRPPAEITDQPVLSLRRWRATAAYDEDLAEEAYAAIVAARPESASGERWYGDIWLPVKAGVGE